MLQETEPRALRMASMCSTTELYLWPLFKNLRQNASKFHSFSTAGVTGVCTCVHAHTM